jgi:outer membrane receptor protein involved in Fe transport
MAASNRSRLSILLATAALSGLAAADTITAGTLVESNQVRIQDFYTKFPGLDVNVTQQSQIQLSVRGLSGAVTIDDVPISVTSFLEQAGGLGLDLDPSGLAQVELLRGPQGTLYGANSEGGLLRYYRGSEDRSSGRPFGGRREHCLSRQRPRLELSRLGERAGQRRGRRAAGRVRASGPRLHLVTPQYKFSSNMMVYARVATGYAPGAANPAAEGVPPMSKPDTVIDYELGTKINLLNNRWSIDASAYHIEHDDIQQGLFSEEAQFYYTGNAGSATSEGLELSTEIRPATGLRISSCIAYNQSEITDLPPSSSLASYLGQPLPFSPNRNF